MTISTKHLTVRRMRQLLHPFVGALAFRLPRAACEWFLPFAASCGGDLLAFDAAVVDAVLDGKLHAFCDAVRGWAAHDGPRHECVLDEPAIDLFRNLRFDVTVYKKASPADARWPCVVARCSKTEREQALRDAQRVIDWLIATYFETGELPPCEVWGTPDQIAQRPPRAKARAKPRPRIPAPHGKSHLPRPSDPKTTLCGLGGRLVKGLESTTCELCRRLAEREGSAL